MTGNTTTVEKAREGGFTLVEVLVALALFSLLVTVLLNGVRFGLKAWTKASTDIEQLDQSLVVQDVLRRIVGNLYPMTVADNGGPPLVDFDGGRDSIGFLSNAPLVAAGAGRFRYSIFVERRNEQSDLVLAATPELARAEDRSMTARTILLAGINSAEFSYLEETRAGQDPKWTDGWSKRSNIPRLIRLRLTLRANDTHAWPDLLIAPRILADVGCVYDAITRRCQGR